MRIVDFAYFDQLYDDYKPQVIRQTSDDYFINAGWSDALIKQFRKNVRRQNICVRMGYSVYSSMAEQKKIGEKIPPRALANISLEDKKALFEKNNIDWWIPNIITYPDGFDEVSQ